jgi:hypothetical protein
MRDIKAIFEDVCILLDGWSRFGGRIACTNGHCGCGLDTHQFTGLPGFASSAARDSLVILNLEGNGFSSVTFL